jgi:hypothetical protein
MEAIDHDQAWASMATHGQADRRIKQTRLPLIS